jgi:hypothetical protein
MPCAPRQGNRRRGRGCRVDSLRPGGRDIAGNHKKRAAESRDLAAVAFTRAPCFLERRRDKSRGSSDRIAPIAVLTAAQSMRSFFSWVAGLHETHPLRKGSVSLPGSPRSALTTRGRQMVSVKCPRPNCLPVARSVLRSRRSPRWTSGQIVNRGAAAE